MTRFKEITPKTPRELEQFYLQTVKKLAGTDTTLAIEEQKSMAPVFGMIAEVNRRLESLEKGANRKTKSSVDLKRNDLRMMKAQLNRLEARIKDIERQL